MLECLDCDWTGDEQELVNGQCPVCGGEVTDGCEEYTDWQNR